MLAHIARNCDIKWVSAYDRSSTRFDIQWMFLLSLCHLCLGFSVWYIAPLGTVSSILGQRLCWKGSILCSQCGHVGFSDGDKEYLCVLLSQNYLDFKISSWKMHELCKLFIRHMKTYSTSTINRHWLQYNWLNRKFCGLLGNCKSYISLSSLFNFYLFLLKGEVMSRGLH
jgi:hypothetical protein